MNDLPWHVYQDFTSNPKATGGAVCTIKSQSGSVIAFVPDRENADKIVNCVNEYAELLDNIAEAKLHLEVMKQDTKDKDKYRFD